MFLEALKVVLTRRLREEDGDERPLLKAVLDEIYLSKKDWGWNSTEEKVLPLLTDYVIEGGK